MADTEEKLSRFQAEIDEEIKGEIDEILTSAKKKADAILAEADDEFIDDSYVKVSTETKAIKQELNKSVSHKSFEANREILAHRNKLVDDFFDGISGKVLEFTKSEKYTDYMKKAAEEANSAYPFYDGVTAYVKPADRELAVKLLDGYKIAVETDKSIKLGGITFRYPEENRYVDRTLDESFRKEKENFVSNSAMQL